MAALKIVYETLYVLLQPCALTDKLESASSKSDDRFFSSTLLLCLRTSTVCSNHFSNHSSACALSTKTNQVRQHGCLWRVPLDLRKAKTSKSVWHRSMLPPAALFLRIFDSIFLTEIYLKTTVVMFKVTNHIDHVCLLLPMDWIVFTCLLRKGQGSQNPIERVSCLDMCTKEKKCLSESLAFALVPIANVALQNRSR